MKKIYIITFATTLTIAISGLFSVDTHSNPNGAPAGASGAPNDPANGCARSGCHSGGNTARAGLIGSDIPSQGYTPGQTYTFTVQIEQAGISKWGFQISPQAANGTLLGTLILTNTSETRFAAGGSKYVTQTTAGNSGSTGSKSWTFDWTAPAAGTGPVTFYANVNASNANNSTSGDLIFNESVTYEEAGGVGFDQVNASSVEVFPNPSNTGFLSLKGLSNGLNHVEMFDVSGKLVFNQNINGTIQTISTNDFVKGIYFLSVENKQGKTVKKIIIQ